jgi:hypothetical protein
MSRSNAAKQRRLYVHQHVGNTGLALLDRRFLSSAVFGLCLDDVRIGTCIAVKGSDSVVVERIGSQAGHILTSHNAHIAIPITENVSTK